MYSILRLCLLLGALLSASALQISDADSLKLYFIGDWGGDPNPPYTTNIQLQVASLMEKMAETFQPQFILTAGDSFYYDGVTSISDQRFNSTFENVYSTKLIKDLPWLIVAGNHDHRGDIQAQIAYSKISQRWHYPSLWYSETFQFSTSTPPVRAQFIFFDTVVLSGQPTRGGFTGPSDPQLAQEQLDWLEEQLAKSTADWIFVSGHYPVYSVGNHGPTPDMINKVLPILEKYGVAAYLCGHDHNMQHIQLSNSTVDLYLSGTGHDSENIANHKNLVPEGSLKFFWPVDSADNHIHGAVSTMEIKDRKSMTLSYYSDSGDLIYTHHKVNPRA